VTALPDYDALPDTTPEEPEIPPCRYCGGQKFIVLPPNDLADHRAVRCPECKGTGLAPAPHKPHKSGVVKKTP